MNYAIRYDNDWDTSKELFSKIVENCEKVVAYEHPATADKQVHIHALVWGYRKGEDTLRNLCKRLSKGSYECKSKIRRGGAPVDENFITYMSKGKYEPVCLNGWCQEFIIEQKAKGYDKLYTSGGKLLIDKGVKVDGIAPPRKTRKELVKDIVDDIGEGIRRLDERDVCEVIRTHLIRNNEVVGMYKVIDLYDSVLMYGSPDQWLDMVSRKIISRTRI